MRVAAVHELSLEVARLAVDVQGLVDVVVLLVLNDRGHGKWSYFVVKPRMGVPNLRRATGVHEVFNVLDGEASLPARCKNMVPWIFPLRLGSSDANVVYHFLVHVRICLPVGR